MEIISVKTQEMAGLKSCLINCLYKKPSSILTTSNTWLNRATISHMIGCHVCIRPKIDPKLMSSYLETELHEKAVWSLS